MLQKLRGNNQKGFTLIELMIVIAIIGILSAIAIPNFLKYRQKGQEAAAESTAKNFASTAMAYFGDLGTVAGVLVGTTNGNQPRGFELGDNVTSSTTSITMNEDGNVGGSVIFGHKNSTKEYTVLGAGSDIITTK
jgi:prepilin-type N-terminal cleavage/methylation domain-containing protein